MGRYNFEAISDIDLVELAISMGYVVKKCGSVYKMSCPKANGGDTDPSLVIKSNNKFNCYHCPGDYRGDASDFVMGALNCSREESLKYLAKRYPFIVNPVSGEESADSSPEAMVSRAVYSVTELHKRDQEKYNHELVRSREVLKAIQEGRGLSLDTIGHFGMGVATWGAHPRLTLPNYDAKGRILSFTTRKLVANDTLSPYIAKNIYIRPKLDPPYYDRIDEDYEGEDRVNLYEKHAWFYHVYEAVKSGMPIFIVEGHLDVAALYELGQHGAIAIGTHTITDKQCMQLASLMRHHNHLGPIIFVPDNDKKGRETFFDNYKTLRTNFPDTVLGYLNVLSIGVIDVKDMGDVVKKAGHPDQPSREELDLMFTAALKKIPSLEAKVVEDICYENSPIEAMAKINDILRIATEPFGRTAILERARSMSGVDPSIFACAFEGRIEGM